ncbi:hypothetical protein L227DRAFT_421332 [Lentinus tigrinus ALCF2SS1-6]|uniref:Uncharacterized protein n=1 Tax=Lentinus tigrinus ALCF2SS1-6 TaxID=1328759 RepID=A0A5C2RPK1_9APHY|nr:hypothetical protein L227DRAFT_421332 [Lentinus tigrinus ALCF2SS1-6]
MTSLTMRSPANTTRRRRTKRTTSNDANRAEATQVACVERQRGGDVAASSVGSSSPEPLSLRKPSTRTRKLTRASRRLGSRMHASGDSCTRPRNVGARREASSNEVRCGFESSADLTPRLGHRRPTTLSRRVWNRCWPLRRSVRSRRPLVPWRWNRSWMSFCRGTAHAETGAGRLTIFDA